MKEVLIERGLWRARLHMACKDGCDVDATACCATRILKRQPDFQAQKSLVQKVIETAGHFCIFLLKFHCELNFIEFFWGAVKRWLHENCDYTFKTLQEMLPKALKAVEISTIQKWEHQMVWWLHAYHMEMSAKNAQFHVH